MWETICEVDLAYDQRGVDELSRADLIGKASQIYHGNL